MPPAAAIGTVSWKRSCKPYAREIEDAFLTVLLNRVKSKPSNEDARQVLDLLRSNHRNAVVNIDLADIKAQGESLRQGANRKMAAAVQFSNSTAGRHYQTGASPTRNRRRNGDDDGGNDDEGSRTTGVNRGRGGDVDDAKPNPEALKMQRRYEEEAAAAAAARRRALDGEDVKPPMPIDWARVSGGDDDEDGVVSLRSTWEKTTRVKQEDTTSTTVIYDPEEVVMIDDDDDDD